MLKLVHNAGFFSCCSIRIFNIISYFTEHKSLPKEIDCSGLFNLYKINKSTDITCDFFILDKLKHDEHILDNIIYEKHIHIDKWNFQFDNYKNVDYKSILPFVNKYFSPSQQIIDIRDDLILKYNIDVNNCIAIYYRGTDKQNETEIDCFDSYYNKLIEIIEKESNKHIQILIQSDSAQFLDFMKEKCVNKNIIIVRENSSTYSNNGIHYQKNGKENYMDIQTLYSTFLIISKCKYIICSSGNCSIWIMYYRGHCYNTYQNLNKKWL